MNWFARHPRVALLLLFTADVFAMRKVDALSSHTSDALMAGWPALCACCLLFGPPCILFPDILGGMSGPAGRGAWLNETPGSLVTVIGWLALSIPLLVLLGLSLTGRAH